jgi:hypothetical protein
VFIFGFNFGGRNPVRGKIEKKTIPTVFCIIHAKDVMLASLKRFKDKYRHGTGIIVKNQCFGSGSNLDPGF